MKGIKRKFSLMRLNYARADDSKSRAKKNKWIKHEQRSLAGDVRQIEK